MDYTILNWINSAFGNSKFLAVLARIISFLGNKWFLIGVVVLLLCFKKTRKVGFYIMIAGGVTWLFNDFVIKNIVKRARPFVTHSELSNMCLLSGDELPDGYSMASGHAATTMAIAVMLMFFSKKIGGCAIGLSVITGLSRLILCVHYPTDVFVGWCMGVALAVGLFYATNLALKIINSKWGKSDEKVSNSNNKQK